jgi:cytochrome c oxidase subunit 3
MSQTARYFVPDPSRWPIFGSVALLCMASGTALWINDAPWGKFVLIAGLCILVYMLFGWFGRGSRKRRRGKYSPQSTSSFRWGMSWFIFSEVMFFAAFLARCSTCECCQCHGWAISITSCCGLDFTEQWPTAGPGFAEKFTPMAAWACRR